MSFGEQLGQHELPAAPTAGQASHSGHDMGVNDQHAGVQFGGDESSAAVLLGKRDRDMQREVAEGMQSLNMLVSQDCYPYPDGMHPEVPGGVLPMQMHTSIEEMEAALARQMAQDFHGSDRPMAGGFHTNDMSFYNPGSNDGAAFSMPTSQELRPPDNFQAQLWPLSSQALHQPNPAPFPFHQQMGTLQAWEPSASQPAALQQAAGPVHFNAWVPDVPQPDFELEVAPRVLSGSGEAPTPCGSSHGGEHLMSVNILSAGSWSEQLRSSNTSTEASRNATPRQSTDAGDMMTPRGSVAGENSWHVSLEEQRLLGTGQGLAPLQTGPSLLRKIAERKVASERMLRPGLPSKAEMLAGKSKSDRYIESYRKALPPRSRRRSSTSTDGGAGHSVPMSPCPAELDASVDADGSKATPKGRTRYAEQMERIQRLETKVLEINNAGESIAEQLEKAQAEVERLRNRERELLAIQRVFDSQRRHLSRSASNKSQRTSES